MSVTFRSVETEEGGMERHCPPNFLHELVCILLYTSVEEGTTEDYFPLAQTPKALSMILQPT